MGIIATLSETLANQIAAGEVVERPASVVKELLENALDASATRVRVEIERGGVDLVRIVDDGTGMDPEDARRCFERHATSKIRSFDDLSVLSSFGFRGEALPSIASVSKLTLRTRQASEPEGVEVAVEGGTMAPPRPVGCPVGTTVEVRDLFYNVPARRKFLKATATEAAHVGETVLLSALARPEVTFQFLRDKKLVREFLRAPSRAERVRQIFPNDPLTTCAAERGPMRIEAHLGPPEKARTGAVALHVLVNHRPVRDRFLARAVAQAYGSVLETGKYPIGAVYIDLPSDLVDVNVHPQKAEVRFTDARGVLDAITRELHAHLGKAFGIPAGPLFRPAPRGTGPFPEKHRPPPKDSPAEWTFERGPRPESPTEGVANPLFGLAEKVAGPWNTEGPGGRSLGTAPRASTAGPSRSALGGALGPSNPSATTEGSQAVALPLSDSIFPQESPTTPSAIPASGIPLRPPPGPILESGAGPMEVAVVSGRGGTFSSSPPSGVVPAPFPSDRSREGPSTQAPAEGEPSPSGLRGVPRFSELIYLAQLRRTFLLCEGKDALFVLDQHAAAERVAFHRLRREFLASSVAVQRLLIPEVVELSALEVELAEGSRDSLAQMGIELRALGPQSVAVDALPAYLPHAHPERTVRNILGELGRTAHRAFSEGVDRMLATMACHGCLRAGDLVAPEEATTLLKALDEVDFAGHCPHGRPIASRIPFDDLEKRVGRP